MTLTSWSWPFTSFSDTRLNIRHLTLTSWPLNLTPWPWPWTSFSDTRLKIWIIHFWPCDLDLLPMTLTFELIQAPLKTNLPTRFQVHMSDGSASRVETDRQTHTDGTENITSSASARGNKQFILPCYLVSGHRSEKYILYCLRNWTIAKSFSCTRYKTYECLDIKFS